MATEKETKTPPYVGYKTYVNFINGLRDTGLPARIDTSLLRNLSGSAQSSLLNSLRFFNFIDDNGKPSAEFQKLVNTPDKDRGPLIKAVMEGTYQFLSDPEFDLRTATAASLGEKFTAMGAAGGTREKAVAFFLASAAQAGIQISPHILKHKHAGSPSSPRKPRQTGQQKRTGGQVDADEGDGDDDDRPPLNPFIQGLLDKLPEPESEWSTAEQVKWLRTAVQIFGLIYKTEDVSLIEVKSIEL